MTIEVQRGIKTQYEIASSHGTARFAIADRDGKVVIYFDKGVRWVEAPNDTMIDMAFALLRRAGFELDSAQWKAINQEKKP